MRLGDEIQKCGGIWKYFGCYGKGKKEKRIKLYNDALWRRRGYLYDEKVLEKTTILQLDIEEMSGKKC